MKKLHIQRIAGYILWALALIVLLPVALLNTEAALPTPYRFTLFTLMVAFLLIGYVLVDGATVALHRRHQHD